MRRIPFVAISIGFVWRREICLGIIYNPILNEFYSARVGHGAHMNDKPIKCSRVESLDDACIGHEISFIHVEKHRQRNAKQVVVFGSAAQG